ncbi:hypothetical protein FPSE_03018 [Fusarium pseudograminearum CS3096]|uniref:Uncharacterized protein n=1 Tax=Fusarium pseudograminearum (strain CS3096) TaxID=1028729 RepID=K3VNW0_FUSPC|nr:hypothetical protein FPSE_03018 [Fusarium pseudograminearum CS3096]EKJ76832.1 hypothetical protein FPSE_03018 [Fusarium pseudograminearum CS3096]
MIEWTEFANLYAKVNGVSLRTTPPQSPSPPGLYNFILSPQDIRDAISAPPPPPGKGHRVGRHHSNSMSYTCNYEPSSSYPVLEGFPPGFPPSHSPPPTTSVPSTPGSWRSESRHSSPPVTPNSSPADDLPSWCCGRWERTSFSPSTARPFSTYKRSTYNRAPKQPAAKQDGCLDLPYQARILTGIQTLLEHACYTFAEQRLPRVLIENGWDCPEAGELNVWMHHFNVERMTLRHVAREHDMEESLSDVMHSAKQIRHNAVHRNRVEINELAMHLDHAVDLCTILGVQEDLDKVKAIRDDTKAGIASMQATKQEVGKGMMQRMKSLGL